MFRVEVDLNTGERSEIPLTADDIAAAQAQAAAYRAPVPDISDRQFFQQLALDGVISQQEALDAVRTGAIPAVLQAMVNGMADPFAATMILSGATTFQRQHPMTEAIGVARGMSSDQIDDFFRRAGAL